MVFDPAGSRRCLLSKLLKWVIGLILVAAIGTVTYGLTMPAGDSAPGARRAAFKGKGKGAQRDTVPVLAAAAETADVPVYLDGLGTARALNTVTVQPLVDGRLLSVNFREGQDVKRGDVLALIDPALYEAQLNQALAKKAQDEANLASARRDLDRAQRVGPIATLQKTIDTARGMVEQLEALVKADQAAIDNAATLLGYTRIVAPIGGRTGIRMVDEGNVVRASANSALVMITEVQPISVLFNLPQQQLTRVNTAMAGNGGRELRAEAIAPDGKTVLDRGTLRVIDNQVDQTTGTIRLKAEFPNANLQLWPGQFVNVRILVDNLLRVVVVPAAAVQQGPSGPFVFAITAKQTVAVRPVKVVQQDEWRAIIAEGLKAGEQVATSSFGRLRDETGVVVTLAPGATSPEALSAADPEAQKIPAKATEGKATEGKAGEGKRARRREAGTGQGTTG